MKYICEHFIPVNNSENRIFTLSSNDKADYISFVLHQLNINTEFISPSITRNKKIFFKRCDSKNEFQKVISGPTLGNIFPYHVQQLFAKIWLLFFLLLNCKRGEWILSYHGIMKIPVMLIVKKLKRIKICLEVEELYYEINAQKSLSKWRKWLEQLMIKSADSYIFASQQLANHCNKQNKPFAIANGRYLTEPIITRPDNDGLIHILYAGLIRTGKVAFNCLNIADYLSSKYRLHIIGYGEQADINELEKAIEKKNKKNNCKIVYDGMKRDDEYKAYLQKCHIGLCPLPANSTLQSACFPSKITSYLANGLRVVTTENEVVRSSVYGEIINFAKSDNADDFAFSIQQIDLHNEYDSRTIIQQCEIRFQKELIQIIGDNK